VAPYVAWLADLLQQGASAQPQNGQQQAAASIQHCVLAIGDFILQEESESLGADDMWQTVASFSGALKSGQYLARLYRKHSGKQARGTGRALHSLPVSVGLCGCL
jgi:hypothetical protein